MVTKSTGVPFTNGLNTLRRRQNGRYFADDTFKRIFLKENVRISIKISLKFVPKSPIDNIPALFQIMAWRRPGDKPLSEAMKVYFLTHICVARPQRVNFIIPAWISNYVHYKVWDEIIYQFPNFNGCTVEFGNGWVISSHIYWACDYLCILVLKLNHVSKRGPNVFISQNKQ